MCILPETSLYSTSCEEIRYVSKRKEILKRDNRCFVCLRNGHITKQFDKNVDDVKDFITNQYARHMILQRKVKQQKTTRKALTRKTQLEIR